MIVAIGISHKTATVAVREKVAFTADLVPLILRQAKNKSKAQELVLLSTCNRTEFYGWIEHPNNIVAWWEQQNVQLPNLSNYLYYYTDISAVRHIMRVASGLDSMVVGEPQILSQLKQAYDIACDQKSIGNYLQRLFQKSFMVAKQVRTETAIGRNPVSVAYSAVKLSQKIFTDLKKARVLLIGAGETIELVAQHLKAQGVTQQTYVNRSFDRATVLANHMQGNVIPFEQMTDHISDFDIIIS
ncbi:MAG TPA: glutamyl-tRNA reductase, partial [Gammaproteobacteria bacterium]|nr:glutamyl-tRNA reductase [Gammaproteobacteria bacterium]